MDEESSERAKKEHPNAGLEGKSGVKVLADIIAPAAGQTPAPETQVNAVTLVKVLNSDDVSAVIRAAVKNAAGEVALGAADL